MTFDIFNKKTQLDVALQALEAFESEKVYNKILCQPRPRTPSPFLRTKIGDDGQFSEDITLEVALQALEAFESEKVNFTKILHWP